MASKGAQRGGGDLAERGTARPAADERCPVCRALVGAAPDNAAYPFCGERCRTIDLGNWLDGSYRVAGPPADPFADDDPEGSGPH